MIQSQQRCCTSSSYTNSIVMHTLSQKTTMTNVQKHSHAMIRTTQRENAGDIYNIIEEVARTFDPLQLLIHFI